MSKWRCVGWRLVDGSKWADRTPENTESMVDAETALEALERFRLGHPGLMNCTAHPWDMPVAVKHKGLDGLPIVEPYLIVRKASQKRKRQRRFVRFNPHPGTQPPSYAEPDCERMMRCWNEYWEAQARWKRRDGVWACMEAGEMIRWMERMSPESAKLNLARRGCQWEWL